MVEIACDEKGFTCLCGLRNDYPGYVREHWSVQLEYGCSCRRRYLLLRGRVTQSSRGGSGEADSEAFGD